MLKMKTRTIFFLFKNQNVKFKTRIWDVDEIVGFSFYRQNMHFLPEKKRLNRENINIFS